ncbi:MAG: hypothetical protein LBO73_01015 [Holosporaceae bacterium]|nr:hypothetical protein [Holosporaceae bacterium]
MKTRKIKYRRCCIDKIVEKRKLFEMYDDKPGSCRKDPENTVCRKMKSSEDRYEDCICALTDYLEQKNKISSTAVRYDDKNITA